MSATYPRLRHRPAPPAGQPVLGDLADLRHFVIRNRRLVVLTGAGCSTESGIPDYRDSAGAWKGQTPVEFLPFMREASVRSRYWARSLIGWRSFGAAKPNAGHHALAALERAGRVHLLVTQNVDGLHSAAGSRRVLDLHGRLDTVACMSCSHRMERQTWQEHLEDLNPRWLQLDAPRAPDGDAQLADLDFAAFAVPDCPQCGGIVKPGVVFFGESVPPQRHSQVTAAIGEADALLVVGSSLMVQSGYRHVAAAAQAGKPVAAVNLGRTRADAVFRLKLEAPVGATLSALVTELGAERADG
jgi:NAD-dependent SIR2 family protein deacetylase